MLLWFLSLILGLFLPLDLCSLPFSHFYETFSIQL